MITLLGLIYPSSRRTFPHRCWVHRVSWIPDHPHGTAQYIL